MDSVILRQRELTKVSGVASLLETLQPTSDLSAIATVVTRPFVTQVHWDKFGMRLQATVSWWELRLLVLMVVDREFGALSKRMLRRDDGDCQVVRRHDDDDE